MGRDRTLRGTLVNLTVLAVTVGVIFGIDRGLLRAYGNTLWTFDPVLHFKHIPGARLEWPEKYDNKPILINRHGHHDDDFPEKKSEGELRILVLGDSVVMGHGMTAEEAFPNQLERLLETRGRGHDSYQVINAGVQGYSTIQYLEVLGRSWRFSPDAVLIGFCMNDVTEPYRIRTEHGGHGIDYHEILQEASWWRGYLINQTGFGRLALRLRYGDVDRRARHETINVRAMTRWAKTDPVFVHAWKAALADLGAMLELTRERNVPLTLLVFPYRFQVAHPSSQEPQHILARYAEESGLAAIDLTPLFEEIVASGAEKSDLFLDRNHLTRRGHRLVASIVFEHLAEQIDP